MQLINRPKSFKFRFIKLIILSFFGRKRPQNDRRFGGAKDHKMVSAAGGG